MYLVDQDGFIYGTTSNAAMALDVQDKTTTPLGIGKTVATTSIVSTYHDIYNQLTAAGFKITNLYVADTLFQIGAVTSGNAKINWQPKNPIDLLLITSYPTNTQVSIILATIASQPDKITNRIDVRVPGYVYVK